MTVTVLSNQSLLDIAVQHTGDPQNAFAIARENGLSLTSFLKRGSSLTIPDTVVVNNSIYDYYTSKQVKPATAIEMDEPVEELDGIGYWIINDTFIVQ